VNGEEHGLSPAPDRWTPGLLKQHYDAVLQARDEDTERTRQGMELRLNGMNEFRQSLNDLSRQFVTRGEMRATVAVGAAIVTAVVAIIELVVK
jgi:hypothetical protein